MILFPILLGDDMGPGALQTLFFEEHMSGTTNVIYMLFTNCLTYNRYLPTYYVPFQPLSRAQVC